MRVEKITKRKRKQDNSIMMMVLGSGLLGWAFISNFLSTSIGFAFFVVVSIYALVYLQRNELGENKKQIQAKKQNYYKDIQTFVFSRNYK